AANTFLSTLDQRQKQNVLFAFDDADQRVRWSNLPVSIVPRKGISLGEMTQAQRTAAMALLSSVLSRRGLEKVQQIMDGDEALKNGDSGGPQGNRGGRGQGGRGGPGGVQFGKDLYYISFLGTPSERNPWTLQFGGHHLALNITIAGERG